MKSTGVVRRVDDLGRIVIPKEIRRTLRIRDGESLEIFVDREMIALKKFSKMDDIGDVSKQLVDITNGVINKNVFITDRDKFIAGSGSLRKKFIDKNISSLLESIMKGRKLVIENHSHEVELINGEKDNLSYVISPIIMNGDAIGLVLIVSENNDISQVEEKLANIVSQFLGKHIEE
ncbi:MAG: AbrB/MazE/SpoVT family DNA-binding domain-containing protein [Firmicutes bacterium]|nr:AbrB/MazE/SpoVT family DNA-binding domain-containing protein [Bacillota bacterium]